MLKNRIFYFYNCLFSLLVTVFSTCQPPDVPVNGFYNSERAEYLVGDKIHYSCSYYYYLMGAITRTCEENGRWTGKTPFCGDYNTYKQIMYWSFLNYRVIGDDNFGTCLSTANDTGDDYKIYLEKPAIVYSVRLYLPKGSAELQVVTVEKGKEEICAKVNRSFEDEGWLYVTCEGHSAADTVLVQGVGPSKNNLEICEMKLFGLYTDNNLCKEPPDVFIPNGWLRITREKAKLECKRGYTAGKDVVLVCDGGAWSQNVLQCEENTKTATIIIVGIIIAGVASFSLVYYFFCVRVRSDRKEKGIIFLNQNAFERGRVDILNPSLLLVEQMDLLPYDQQFEFPKARLSFEKTVGQGAFGRVIKAQAIGLVNGEASTTVAVKMLKETANNEQRKALIAELKILIYLGKHLNIVNLLGAVTRNIGKGELMVIVEYCCFGNLRHYLLKHKEFYINQLNPVTGELDPEYALTHLESEEHHDNLLQWPFYGNLYGLQNLRYAELMRNKNNSDSGVESSSLPSAPSSTKTYPIDIVNSVKRFRAIWTAQNEESTEQRVVTTRDLLAYSFQCARGMEYLASKKLIHRDLAARNVLLASNNIIKICDFGLTKDGYNYVKKKGDGGMLPVKWLAIESIRHEVFTTKSDVWAFGVFLWEIFTLGGNPYPGVEFNYEFVKKLEDGYRMEKPDLAPKSIYQMMQSCWLDDPTQRPDFAILSEKMGLLLERAVREHYIELNIPYTVMNEEYLKNSGCLQMSKQNNEEHYTKVDDIKENGKPQCHTCDNIPFVRDSQQLDSEAAGGSCTNDSI